MPRTIRLAAVQATPVFLDKAATIAKAVDLIDDAGATGANVVGFPEGFVPAHPLWYHFLPASSPKSLGFAKDLSDNAVIMSSGDLEQVQEAAARNHIFVVMGCCEREKSRPGTLYNTLVFIDPTGAVVGRHRKLVPTLGEQLVHSRGDALELETYDSGSSLAVSGLMCGENSNPLATFTLDALGTNVHVAAWPSFFQLGASMPDIIEMVSRSLAYQMKAYVINAAGTVDEAMLAKLAGPDLDLSSLTDFVGGSSIIGPSGETLAGPAGNEEVILYADVASDGFVVPKLVHDFGGRYNRFDLLQLKVNSETTRPITGPSTADHDEAHERELPANPVTRALERADRSPAHMGVFVSRGDHGIQE